MDPALDLPHTRATHRGAPGNGTGSRGSPAGPAHLLDVTRRALLSRVVDNVLRFTSRRSAIEIEARAAQSGEAIHG